MPLRQLGSTAAAAREATAGIGARQAAGREEGARGGVEARVRDCERARHCALRRPPRAPRSPPPSLYSQEPESAAGGGAWNLERPSHPPSPRPECTDSPLLSSPPRCRREAPGVFPPAGRARGPARAGPGRAGLEPSLRRRDRLRRAEGRARALRGAVAAAAARGVEMAAEREAGRLLSTSSSRRCCPPPPLLLWLPLLLLLLGCPASGAAAAKSGSPPQSAGKRGRARDAVGAGARHRLPRPLRWVFCCCCCLGSRGGNVWELLRFGSRCWREKGLAWLKAEQAGGAPTLGGAPPGSGPELLGPVLRFVPGGRFTPCLLPLPQAHPTCKSGTFLCSHKHQ